MNKNRAMAVFLAGFVFLLGMGELGGGPAPIDKIPSPEKNFPAQVVDRQGVQALLQSFSFEGKVFLAAKHGSAAVAVPFEKISAVHFQEIEGGEISARIVLRDQKTVAVKLDRRAKFFGKTDFGTYQVEAKDLKSIRFQF
jgi:hypothetical protein